MKDKFVMIFSPESSRSRPSAQTPSPTLPCPQVPRSLSMVDGLLSIGVTCSSKGLHSGVAGFPSCPSTEWSLLDAGLPWRIGHGTCECDRCAPSTWILWSHSPQASLRGKIFAVSSWNQYQELTPMGGDCQTLTWELIYGGFYKAKNCSIVFIPRYFTFSNLKLNIYHH